MGTERVEHMDHWILTRLVLPLLIISFVSVVIGSIVPGGLDISSLLINLSTEIIGILLTVLYVNWVLESQEEKRWERARERIIKQVDLFALDTILSFMKVLGFQREIPSGVFLATTRGDTLEHWFTIIENRVLPDIEVRLNNLNDDQWINLQETTQRSLQESNRIVDLFSYRLSATHYQLLLDIQANLFSIRGMYQVLEAPEVTDSSELPSYLGDGVQDISHNLTRRAIATTVSLLLRDCIELEKTLRVAPI